MKGEIATTKEALEECINSVSSFRGEHFDVDRLNTAHWMVEAAKKRAERKYKTGSR